jgi:transposase
MSRHDSELTDEQWDKIAPLLPKPKPSPRGGLTPTPNRSYFEGIVWMLRTGARWKDVPQQYPSPNTCWRRLRDWKERGIFLKAWRAFLAQLDAQGQLAWAEAFADGSFAPAKQGARRSARSSGGKARSGWWSTAKVCLWETS